MKNIRKVLAAILALTMTVCLASCGETGGAGTDGGTAANSKVEESKAEEKEESKTEEKEKESKAEEADVTEAFATEAASDFTFEMEDHSIEHAPLAIKLDYAIPKLAKFDEIAIVGKNPDYWSDIVQDKYYYRINGSNSMNFTVSAEIYSKGSTSTFLERDEYTQVKTDNGYSLAYKITEDEEDDGKIKYTADFYTYGESYQDAYLMTRILLTTTDDVLSKEEVEKLGIASSNSVKFTEWNEKALFSDDGSFKFYPHKLVVPAKATVAGKEGNSKFTTVFASIQTEFEFCDDDLQYRIISSTVPGTKSSWDMYAKRDEYTAVKLGNYDALAKFSTSTAGAEYIVKFTDDTIETFNLLTEKFADGSVNKDGKGVSDFKKEIASDENKDSTFEKFTGYMSDFVNSLTVDETVKEPD
ncbi:MAG: hypothetical protein ILP22_00195 [Oscillospiraceae bacterium]|nr:hypothetical protein [Oscillospiraceae bacterium]